MSEVKVDTISERTAAGGVTIDGVLVKDGVATFQTAAGSPLVFEGATADAFETTFAITDPTADRTITFPDSSFTVPTSGFTDIQKIQEVVASGDTNINFDNTKITSTYSAYEIRYFNVVPSTDNVYLRMSFSDDNGSNFDSNHTGSIYNSYSGSSTGLSDDAAGATVSAAYQSMHSQLSFDAGDGVGGKVTIQNPSSTSFITTYQGSGSLLTYHDFQYTTGYGGYWDSLAAVNYIRFYMDSGNIATGTFQLWGYV